MIYDQDDTPLMGVNLHDRGTLPPSCLPAKPTRYELGRKAARLVAAILIAAAVVVVGCLLGYLAWLMATGVQG